jgi:small-conductance mechanosensitive channel
MQTFQDFINDVLGLSINTQSKIFKSILIILVLWILKFVIHKILHKQIKEVKTRYLWRKTTNYIIVVLGILIIGRIWYKGFQSIATFLGLLSAGIAIAIKEVIINIAGWLFIILRRPISVGDRIEVDQNIGDIIDIRLFQFTMMEIGNWVQAEQSTGRVIHIPNSRVFTSAIANYSRGFQYIWNEINVLITFESNWQKAKSILNSIVIENAEHLSKSAAKKVKEASKKYMIFYTKLTPIVYTSVKESGVMLTMRYLCQPRDRRNSEQTMWEKILAAFSGEKDIDFAYPTYRFYRQGEKKIDQAPQDEI